MTESTGPSAADMHLTALRLSGGNGGGDGGGGSTDNFGTSGIFWGMPGFQNVCFALTSVGIRTNSMCVAAVAFGKPNGWGTKFLKLIADAYDQLREMGRSVSLVNGNIHSGVPLAMGKGGDDSGIGIG